MILDDVIHRRCPTLDVLCMSKAPDSFYAANSGGSLTSGISVLQKSLFICAIWMLNFRMNNAWNRYWQGVTHVQLMFTKWGDAFTQICTFIDVTLEQDCNRGTRSDLEAVRREFAHLFSLMSAMATDRLLSGDIVMAQRVGDQKGRWGNRVIPREKLWEASRPKMVELDVISLDVFAGKGGSLVDSGFTRNPCRDTTSTDASVDSPDPFTRRGSRTSVASLESTDSLTTRKILRRASTESSNKFDEIRKTLSGPSATDNPKWKTLCDDALGSMRTLDDILWHGGFGKF